VKKKPIKLTPIPRPAKRAKSTPAKSAGKTADAVQSAPDLSFISENLRPLAFPTADLAFMVGNAFTHPPEQIEQFKASFTQFGIVDVFVVNKRPTPPAVIGGNGRLAAALSLNYSHVPVNFRDLSDADAALLSIVLNRTDEGRGMDKDKLDALLRECNTPNETLAAMLTELAEEAGIVEADAAESQPPLPGVEEKHMVQCPGCGREFAVTA
jgi:hypothetical protein